MSWAYVSFHLKIRCGALSYQKAIWSCFRVNLHNESTNNLNFMLCNVIINLNDFIVVWILITLSYVWLECLGNMIWLISHMKTSGMTKISAAIRVSFAQSGIMRAKSTKLSFLSNLISRIFFPTLIDSSRIRMPKNVSKKFMLAVVTNHPSVKKCVNRQNTTWIICGMGKLLWTSPRFC